LFICTHRRTPLLTDNATYYYLAAAPWLESRKLQPPNYSALSIRTREKASFCRLAINRLGTIRR
jgi:hypothetical protein